MASSKEYRNGLVVLDGGKDDERTPRFNYRVILIVAALIAAHVLLLGYFSFMMEFSDFYKYYTVKGVETSELDVLWFMY